MAGDSLVPSTLMWSPFGERQYLPGSGAEQGLSTPPVRFSFSRDCIVVPSVETNSPLAESRRLLRSDLSRFETVLDRVLDDQDDYLTAAEKELYKEGKKIRPVLLLCCARLGILFDLIRTRVHEENIDIEADDFDARDLTLDLEAEMDAVAGRDLPHRAIHGAVSLEMLHVATLIHDDIIDSAPVRRGHPSFNASRGGNQALLLGNMQFVQAVRLFADTVEVEEDMALVRQVLDTGYQICAGELDELTSPSGEWTTPQLEARYFRTANRKTATLFGLACESGVQLVRGSTKLTYALGRYGRKLGEAFQVMDDLFDVLRTEDQAGKQPGTDLREQRFSLPIVYALDTCAPDHPLYEVMYDEGASEAAFDTALDAVRQPEVVERTYNQARRRALQAVKYVDRIPPNPYQQVLRDVAYHTIDRGFLS